MDVDKLEAGRELDALVAEKVMGWSGPVIISNYPWQQHPPGELKKIRLVPHYSTDDAAAWALIYELESQGFIVCLLDRLGYEELDDGRLASMWRCEFLDEGAHAADRSRGEIWKGIAQAATASLAICRAALKI